MAVVIVAVNVVADCRFATTVAAAIRGCSCQSYFDFHHSF